MSSFDQLLAAVGEDLANCLDRESFSSVRLTCRRAYNRTLRIFTKKFFRHRSIMISERHLQNLIDISENSRIAASVRTIEVSTRCVPVPRTCFEAYRRAILGGFGNIWRLSNAVVKASANETRAYRQRWNDQIRLVRDGLAAKYLLRAVAGFPNCTKVILTGDRLSDGANKLRYHPAIRDRILRREVTDFLMYTWHILLIVASSKHANIREVEIDRTYREAFWGLPRFNTVHKRKNSSEILDQHRDVLTRHLTNVKSLKLRDLPTNGGSW